MTSFWRVIFGLALVCLAMLAVASALPNYLNDEDNLEEPFDIDEPNTDKRSGLDWDQFIRYQRAAHWSRKYGFASSLDNSVNRYENKMRTCSVGGICKTAMRRTFKCRCNSFTFCRTTSKNADATCEYSAVGVVYNQPT